MRELGLVFLLQNALLAHQQHRAGISFNESCCFTILRYLSATINQIFMCSLSIPFLTDDITKLSDFYHSQLSSMPRNNFITHILHSPLNRHYMLPSYHLVKHPTTYSGPCLIKGTLIQRLPRDLEIPLLRLVHR